MLALARHLALPHDLAGAQHGLDLSKRNSYRSSWSSLDDAWSWHARLRSRDTINLGTTTSSPTGHLPRRPPTPSTGLHRSQPFQIPTGCMTCSINRSARTLPNIRAPWANHSFACGIRHFGPRCDVVDPALRKPVQRTIHGKGGDARNRAIAQPLRHREPAQIRHRLRHRTVQDDPFVAEIRLRHGLWPHHEAEPDDPRARPGWQGNDHSLPGNEAAGGAD